MPNANTACLFSTVKNISGKTRVFGYLGERGKRLLANETYTVRGNLIATLGAKTAARKFKALERSVDPCQNDSLQIISTPAVFLLDATTDATKILSVDSGVLGAVDPCWTSASCG